MSITIGIGIGITFQMSTASGQGMTLANATGTYTWSGTYDGAAFSGAETLGAGSSLALYFSNYALLTALDVSDNSLTQASVDSILAKLVAGGGGDGTLDITGNNEPSTSGFNDLTTLITRGWTIDVPNILGAVVEWWDFRTGGTGAAITSHAGEKGVYTLSQSNASYKPIWNASGYCEWDATDDYLEFTVTSGIAAGQLWIETPYGWFKSGVGNFTATTHRLALPNATQILLVDTAALSVDDAALLTAYMGGTEYWFIGKTNNLVLYNRIDNNPNVNYTIEYFGGNAATYSKASSQTGETVDVSAQGLTSPCHMLLPIGVATDNTLDVLLFHANALHGVMPTFYGNSVLRIAQMYSNKFSSVITSSFSANTTMQTFYGYSMRHTGNIPNISLNTAIADFRCNDNLLTGWDGGTVSNTISTFRADVNALSESAVNGLLVAFDTAGRASGTLNLSGGTNAAPTGAGATAKASLSAKGWSVTTN